MTCSQFCEPFGRKFWETFAKLRKFDEIRRSNPTWDWRKIRSGCEEFGSGKFHMGVRRINESNSKRRFWTCIEWMNQKEIRFVSCINSWKIFSQIIDIWNLLWYINFEMGFAFREIRLQTLISLWSKSKRYSHSFNRACISV